MTIPTIFETCRPRADVLRGAITEDLPPLPDCGQAAWPARSLVLEATVHFPWRGGRHPVLDCLVGSVAEKGEMTL